MYHTEFLQSVPYGNTFLCIGCIGKMAPFPDEYEQDETFAFRPRPKGSPARSDLTTQQIFRVDVSHYLFWQVLVLGIFHCLNK